ncbi:MAG: BamA/TamA family outer membrane protein [Cyclobacteriaceae bacterium]
MKKLLVIILILPFFSTAQKVFLIGDAGELDTGAKTFQLLSQKYEGATENDLLLFLGDNLYPKGLPDKEHPDRAEMEKKLDAQLDLMKNFKGRSYMIPGNHDWAQGRNYGWKQAMNMEEYVRAYLERDDAFVPVGACPGPLEIELNSSLVLIVLNTQYFLHGWDKPREDGICENKSTAEALDDLRLTVEKHKNKHVIIAAHHPVYTYGEHNGNFALKEHIFPLTVINKNLMLPLPVVGSIHPLFRKSIGNIQDNTHPKYKAIMKAIVSAMDESDNVIFASGHEHSLQLIQRDGHHFVVSGSGSKATNLKKGKSVFGKSERGFSEIQLDGDGKASIKFWGTENGLLFESELYKKEFTLEQIASDDVSFENQTISVAASQQYGVGKGKKKWLGENYRDLWATPVKVDVFDIGSEHGGLKVLKKGGGMQTKSLRMEAADGRQYVLRSIEKYTENAMPAALRNTFAQGIVQDQISASHPYGAFVVPRLADAAQIYHTNPKPVWIPDDPRLGQFQQIFAGTLAVYEERPNKEAAFEPHFGGGKNVRGTFDVIEKLQKDNDNTVDHNFVVRNRLFDMWIGDWDRHDDQWRWAEIEKEGKGNLYRPIPRDRDQVFFINEGIIPKISSRKWAIPKIEGFDEEVRWAPGISQNARFFDRSFLSEPDWADWEEQIAFLQKNLTDEVIAEALSGWPEDVQKLTAERASTGLKARRSDMNRYARELYLYLAKEVEILGSDKHEYFLIERRNENETMVTVHKRKKNGEVEDIMYQRLFKGNETKEIRLYGQDGEDIFEIKGDFKSKTKIRIIGGTDKDRIIGGDTKLKNVLVYDREKSTEFEGNRKGISRLSKDPEINSYDRRGFKYDILMPLASIQFTPDDGIFFGGGFIYTKHAWRKIPFASRHTVLANFSADTESFNFKYTGSFTDAIGKWSFDPKVVVQKPFFVNNFFGIGNETKFLENQFVSPDDDDIDYYRVKTNRIEADFDLTKKLGGKGQFYAGVGYRSVEVEETPNRFISDVGLDREDFDKNNFTKLRAGISVDARNSKVLPTRGTTARADIEYFDATESFSRGFTRLSAEWAFFFSARLPSRLVFGNRVGVAHNIGDTEFFNANTLGGLSNLRGYRRTRFYGDTYFYHNFDLRLKLFSFRSYIFPGQFGILGFHDVGRVWVDGESSNNWHTGKGGGIWVSPLNSAVLSLNYGIGEDENLIVLNLGFFF